MFSVPKKVDKLNLSLSLSLLTENLIEINIFSFKKMRLQISFAKWRPFCPGGDELKLPAPEVPPDTLLVICAMS